MIDSLLYLAGPPGVGKSSVARELTQSWDRFVSRYAAVPHTVLSHPVSGQIHGVELGVPRETFSGTDALAMDIGPRALDWMRGLSVPFALGEGSRLATRPFLSGLARGGVKVVLVRLTADEELLTQRWQDRGAKQNPAWRKGAATRAQRLGDWFSEALSAFPEGCTHLDMDVTDMTVADVADRVRDVFPPIVLGD